MVRVSHVKPITLALSKGRILEQTLPLLAPLGIEPLEDPETSRQLVVPTQREDVRLIIVRATDVPTYVAYGGADIGVAGKDVLLEQGGHGLYEPVDLGIARCRLMVAGPAETNLERRRLRVATKFVNVTRRYFAARGRQVDLIKLYGSMELAPMVGLADVIVDLVDTGNTLRANGMVPLELITDITARLVVNKTSMKLRHDELKPMIAQIAELAG